MEEPVSEDMKWIWEEEEDEEEEEQEEVSDLHSPSVPRYQQKVTMKKRLSAIQRRTSQLSFGESKSFHIPILEPTVAEPEDDQDVTSSGLMYNTQALPSTATQILKSQLKDRSPKPSPSKARQLDFRSKQREKREEISGTDKQGQTIESKGKGEGPVKHRKHTSTSSKRASKVGAASLHNKKGQKVKQPEYRKFSQPVQRQMKVLSSTTLMKRPYKANSRVQAIQTKVTMWRNLLKVLETLAAPLHFDDLDIILQITMKHARERKWDLTRLSSDAFVNLFESAGFGKGMGDRDDMFAHGLFQIFDAQSSIVGEVDYRIVMLAFCQILPSETLEKKLRFLFALNDMDGDNLVGRNELLRFLIAASESESREITALVEHLFKEFDASGTNSLSETDFVEGILGSIRYKTGFSSLLESGFMVPDLSHLHGVDEGDST